MEAGRARSWGQQQASRGKPTGSEQVARAASGPAALRSMGNRRRQAGRAGRTVIHAHTLVSPTSAYVTAAPPPGPVMECTSTLWPIPSSSLVSAGGRHLCLSLLSRQQVYTNMRGCRPRPCVRAWAAPWSGRGSSGTQCSVPGGARGIARGPAPLLARAPTCLCGAAPARPPRGSGSSAPGPGGRDRIR